MSTPQSADYSSKSAADDETGASGNSGKSNGESAMKNMVRRVSIGKSRKFTCALEFLPLN